MRVERGNWSGAELAVLQVETSHKLLDQLQEREEDLETINGNFTTGFLPDLFLPMFEENILVPSLDFVRWFLSYSSIYDGFIICIVLLPIVCVYLCQLLINGRPPLYQEKGFDDQFHNIPTVPLVFLQQNTEEKVLRRPRRNTIEWYASKFVVRVSDNLLYLNDLTIPIVPPEEVRNPWKSVRIMNKFNALYHKNRESGGKQKTEVEKREAEKAERRSWRSLAVTPAPGGEHKSTKDHRNRVTDGAVSDTSNAISDDDDDDNGRIDVERAPTINLLDEAYSAWKERLLTHPSMAMADNEFKSVDDYSVLNHQLQMERAKTESGRSGGGRSRSRRGRRGKSKSKLHRQIAWEEKQLDKELAMVLVSPEDVSRYSMMAAQLEKKKKLRQARKQFSSRVGKSKSRRHRHHHHEHHHHPTSAASRGTTTEPETNGVNPRTVQFHEHANVRVVKSSQDAYHDQQVPIRRKTPEELATLQKFLSTYVSKPETK